MSEALLTALGLVFVIEGLTYALVPGGIKRLMTMMLQTSDEQLRVTGAFAVALGVLIVWLVRGSGAI